MRRDQVDCYQRCQKNFTLQPARKSSSKKADGFNDLKKISIFLSEILKNIFFVFSGLLLWISCKNSPPTANTLGMQEKALKENAKSIKKEILKSKNASILIGQGKNYFLNLTDDEKKLIFVSSDRKNIPGAQVYEVDLETLKEQRITYNDGENRFPLHVSTKENIVYSSNTDSIKESPSLFYPNNKILTFNLFSMNIDSGSIEKISEDKINDYPLSTFTKSEEFYFIRHEEKERKLYLSKLGTEKIFLISNLRPETLWLKYLPQKKWWLWIDKVDGHFYLQLGNSLYAKKNIKTFEIPFTSIHTLSTTSEDDLLVTGTLASTFKAPPKDGTPPEIEKKLEKDIEGSQPETITVARIKLEKGCYQINSDFQKPLREAIFIPSLTGSHFGKNGALIYTQKDTNQDPIKDPLKSVPQSSTSDDLPLTPLNSLKDFELNKKISSHSEEALPIYIHPLTFEDSTCFSLIR